MGLSDQIIYTTICQVWISSDNCKPTEIEEDRASIYLPYVVQLVVDSIVRSSYICIRQSVLHFDTRDMSINPQQAL